MNARSKVQQKAVRATLKAFKGCDRGKVIMPCGTGKTRVGIQVREGLKAKTTLVLCPAISLVKQNLDAYLSLSKTKFSPTVVCSDDSSATEARDEYGIEVEITTDAGRIASAAKRGGNQVFFGTYQSAEQIAAAGVQFDLIVFDEAHRTAGTEGVFSLALHDHNIQAAKRLFLTATPRTMRPAMKSRAAQDGIEVVCMDDEALYGKELYRLEFSEAVSLGLLTDYSVVIFGVKASSAKEWMQENGRQQAIAARIGLLKAMEKYKIRKVISYHSSTKAAREMASDELLGVTSIFGRMKQKKQVAGKAWSASFDGKTPVQERSQTLQEFAELPSDVRAILANCKVLTEGVDAPAVDAVAFMDPKSSVTDIVQAIGRCMRLCEGKHRSFVVVPVFIPEAHETIEDKPERWEQVLSVVRALRDHDSRIEAAIKLRRDSDEDGEEKEPRLLDAIPQFMLENISEELLGHLEPRILGAPRMEGWTNEEIKVVVDGYFMKHGKRPSCESSKEFMRIDAWLRIHRGSTIAQWLNEYAYAGAPNLSGWTNDEIKVVVDEYIKKHGRRPSAGSSREFGRINTWLRNYGSSLAKWLYEHGYGRVKNLDGWTDEEIKSVVDEYVNKHGKRPSCETLKLFYRINGWLRYRGSSLSQWLDEHGYPKNSKSAK